MNQILRKFIPRAPRYVLRPGDSEVMRFSPKSGHGKIQQTKFLNISQTGLAFMADSSQTPHIGEMIKIEFSIPGGEQVAWWAKVVRIEAYSDSRWWDKTNDSNSTDHIVIAVTYVDLPEGHRRQIQQGLSQRFKELKKQYYFEGLQDFGSFIRRNFWNFVLFGLCAITAVMAIGLFTYYEPLFDRKNGSIYFQMFEGLDF